MSIKKDIQKNWLKYEKDQLHIDAELPNTIMLEVTNSCNLACTMCMNPKMERKKGFMNLELVEKIMIQAKEMDIKNIALYTTGEALLHPKIFEIIEICKKYERYVYLTTNAQLLNEEKINKLLTSKIDSIKYSIDGLNKTEYENIRIGGNYEKVLKNISLLKQERDFKNFNTKLSMGIILTKNNIIEKQKYIDIYEKYVDEIIFSLISNQTGHISKTEYNKLKPDFELSTNWQPCRQLWDRIVVTYDGFLTTCCIDFEAELKYANVNEYTLLDYWNNSKIQQFRRNHINHSLNDMPLCVNCDSPYIQQLSIFEKLNER